ncbi:MAG: endo-1,4-beta-xylanase [Clostridia bacterium]|nr:endo-1,4-beta-xylanase [Clostridia bacterium]
MNRRETVFSALNRNYDLYKSRTESGIELYRKGKAQLVFKDSKGDPIKGIRFQAKLKKHSYKFGCNLFMLDEFETQEKNKLYREIFADTFNYAIVPFYWNGLEPEKGKPRYAKDSPRVYRRPSPDLCVEYCRENGIGMKGHCLVYDAFSPEWFKGNAEDLWLEYDRHFEEISNRYKEDIRDWDVINETLCWNPYTSTAIYRDRRMVEKSHALARKYFDRNTLFINEAAQIWEGFKHNRSGFYMQLENLEQKNVHFDGIGLQMHMFCPREKEMERGENRYNPLIVYDVLDTFGEFGKPLHISEVTVPSYAYGKEDEDIQAELIRMLYTLWFSHRSTDSIVYWNLVDGYSHGAPLGDMTSGENVYGGGLLNFDMSEKPAFKVVKDLIKNEWVTNVCGETDDGGRMSFRGFKGEYELLYFADNKEYKTEFTISENFDKETVITVQ